MKKALWALAILGITAGTSYGQDKAALDKALIANEHKINEAVAKGDKATFVALVAPNAFSADGGGFMKVSEFAEMLPQLKITKWAMSDEKVTWADASTAIVTSKWTGSGTFQGQPVSSPSYCSTVWTKKGDKWVAVYHQESEAKK